MPGGGGAGEFVRAVQATGTTGDFAAASPLGRRRLVAAAVAEARRVMRGPARLLRLPATIVRVVRGPAAALPVDRPERSVEEQALAAERDPAHYTGRAEQQVGEFLGEYLEPLLERARPLAAPADAAEARRQHLLTPKKPVKFM